MPQSLVLVHTVPPLIEVFNRLAAERLPGVKVLHILDEAMLERVKRRGGLAAEDGARLAEHVACAAAITALLAGDGATHDRLVSKAALDLTARSDVVVLAQASMARALAVMLEAQRPAPILSSPHLALRQISVLLAGKQAPAHG